MTAGGGGVARFALRQTRAIGLAAVGLCAWGAVSFTTMPSGIYPDLVFPRIVVIAERGEEALDNVLVSITRPLEDAVSAVPGISRVRSKTIRGACEMSIDVAPSVSANEALAQTRAAVGTLVSSLPSGVKTTVELQTPSIFPVISFNATLDPKATGTVKDVAELRAWAETELKPRLARLQDVFRVTVQGSDEPAIVVEVDPARLASAKVSLSDAAKAVREAQAIEAVGVLERDHRRFQLMSRSEPKTPEDFGAIPVAVRGGSPIVIDDVARVARGNLDRTQIVTGAGKNAVVVSVFMRAAGDVVSLSDHVKSTIADTEKDAPEGVHLASVYDQADLVREALASIREAIGIGMILAILILWVFLASIRLSLLAGLAIPISVLATFAGLKMLGASLNLMSAGGVAVAIGSMIADAIVVAENLARKLSGGGDRRALAREATAEVTRPVVGSTLTTVVVFIPLALLEGVVGQFFAAMAIAVTIGILASLAASLLLLPGLGAGRLGPKPGLNLTRGWVEWIGRSYERSLARVLRRPWLAALVLLAILGAAIVPSMTQKTGFLPKMDEGAFVIDYTMPVGTSLEETDAACRRIEDILLAVPEVKSFSRRTGAEIGFFATEAHMGDILVGLKSHADRRRSAEEVVAEVRDRLEKEIPQVEVKFVQVLEDTINDLAGNPAPIEVRAFGPDDRRLHAAATEIADALQKIPGIVDVVRDASEGSPEIDFVVDGAASARWGLSPADVAAQLKTGIDGEEVGRVRAGERLIPVVVRYPDAARRDASRLSETPLFTPAGAVIPASSVASLTERRVPSERARENGQPLVAVDAGIAGRDLGSTAADVRAYLAKRPHERGLRFELAGQVESQARAFKNLVTVISLAIGLVLLVLVIQFRSFRLPLVVLLAVPYALVGGLLALRLMNLPLDVSGLMGLVMLVGLVVKNGIILLEYTAQVREEGEPTLLGALLRASRVRLRPILITSLTTVVALLPLAFGIGTGSEIQRPLAVAIIGGLLVSTVMTLLVVPTAHLIVGEPQHEGRVGTAP